MFSYVKLKDFELKKNNDMKNKKLKGLETEKK